MSTDVAEPLTRAGDRRAADRLIPAVYDDLRALARRYLAKSGRCLTLQATALVHEAFLRLVDKPSADIEGRTHFRAIAAAAMRHILIDHDRQRQRAKRGAGWQRITLDQAGEADARAQADAVDFTEALERLGELDKRAARVVELRFLGGLSEPEIGNVLGVSERTVRNDWRMARAWLCRELGAADAEGDE